MELSGSKIKKILIFCQKKAFLIFSPKKAFLIFPEMEPCTFHLRSKNKNDPPRKNFYTSGNRNTGKNFLYFLKRKLILYFRKRKL